MAKLASLDVRLARLREEEAEILLERAKLFAGEAGEKQPTDMRASRRHLPPPPPPIPTAPAGLPQVSELDLARAQRALRKNEIKRRSAR